MDRVGPRGERSAGNLRQTRRDRRRRKARSLDVTHLRQSVGGRLTRSVPGTVSRVGSIRVSLQSIGCVIDCYVGWQSWLRWRQAGGCLRRNGSQSTISRQDGPGVARASAGREAKGRRLAPRGRWRHAQSCRHGPGRGRPQRRRQGGVLVGLRRRARAASGRSESFDASAHPVKIAAEVPDFDMTPFVPGGAPQEPQDHGPGRPLRRGRRRPGGRGQRAGPGAREPRPRRRRHGHRRGADGPARDRPAAGRGLRRGRPAARRPAGQARQPGAVPAVDPQVPAEHDGGAHLADPRRAGARTARSRRPAPPARRPSARRSA